MTERLQLLDRMVKHDISPINPGILVQDGGWFDRIGRLYNPVEDYSLTVDMRKGQPPDLWATRTVAAHKFGVGFYPDTFYRVSGRDNPRPTENDRKLYVDWMEFYLTYTGLLSVPEVNKIKARGFWTDDIMGMPTELFAKKDVPLKDFSEVASQVASWKKDGWDTALFTGAFDPVTVTHIANGTWAYMWGIKTETPIKVVIGFDGDKLIKRKGKNRPRYNLDTRREDFGAFWMVDETVVMRADRPEAELFVKDYDDLGIDYLVTTDEPHEVVTRGEALILSKRYPIVVPQLKMPSATEILNNAKRKSRKRKH